MGITHISNVLAKAAAKLSGSPIRRRSFQGLATLLLLAVPVGVMAAQNDPTEAGTSAEGKASTTMSTSDTTPSPANISVDVNHDSSIDVSSGSSHSVKLRTSSDANTADSLNVNGQDVPLPQGTSVHKTVSADGSTAQVDVSVNNSSSSSSSSSVNINVSSDSQQESDSE